MNINLFYRWNELCWWMRRSLRILVNRLHRLPYWNVCWIHLSLPLDGTSLRSSSTMAFLFATAIFFIDILPKRTLVKNWLRHWFRMIFSDFYLTELLEVEPPFDKISIQNVLVKFSLDLPTQSLLRHEKRKLRCFAGKWSRPPILAPARWKKILWVV